MVWFAINFITFINFKFKLLIYYFINELTHNLLLQFYIDIFFNTKTN